MASTALKQRHSIKKNVLVRSPEYSTQFRRDVKRMQKRGKDMSKLKAFSACSSKKTLCRSATKIIPQ